MRGLSVSAYGRDVGEEMAHSETLRVTMIVKETG